MAPPSDPATRSCSRAPGEVVNRLNPRMRVWALPSTTHMSIAVMISFDCASTLYVDESMQLAKMSPTA